MRTTEEILESIENLVSNSSYPIEMRNTAERNAILEVLLDIRDILQEKEITGVEFNPKEEKE